MKFVIFSFYFRVIDILCSNFEHHLHIYQLSLRLCYEENLSNLNMICRIPACTFAQLKH